MNELSTIPKAAEYIAHLAKMHIDFTGESPADALTAAATEVTRLAGEARTRTGMFTVEMRSELLEEWLFLGSVARDILDGDVSRPSTGNVREFALARMA